MVVEGDALDLDWHALAGGRVSRHRQHPLQHHLAPARQGAAPAAARAHRVSGTEGGGRSGHARAGTPDVRRAEHRGSGRRASGTAVHRAGGRVPAAAQGGLGGAAADAAGRAADRAGGAGKLPRGWSWACSASGASRCCAALRELTGWDAGEGERSCSQRAAIPRRFAPEVLRARGVRRACIARSLTGGGARGSFVKHFT